MPTPTKPTAAPTEKPVHVAQRTLLSTAKTCAENFPQAGWCPRKLKPSHAFEAFWPFASFSKLKTLEHDFG
jgi:hypothetical protein